MAFDAFLKFVKPQVVGEAGDPEKGIQGYKLDRDREPKGWIRMDEYSFSTTMAVTAARGGTGSATTGKGKLEPFTFKKNVDGISTTLAFHAAAGTIFETIVVNVFATVSDGSKQDPYLFLSIEMKGAVINSCKFSGGGGDDLPTEDVSITYGSIEYKYNAFTIDDTSGAFSQGRTTSVQWNTIKNTGTKS